MPGADLSDLTGPSEIGRKRFHTEDFEDLADISDPHTWDDETTTSFRERWRQNKIWYTFLLVLTLFLSAWLVLTILKYAPRALDNVVVRVGGSALLILVTGFFFGARNTRNQVQTNDKLVLLGNGEPTHYWGRFRPAEEGDYPLFVPVKGLSFNGSLGEPYTVGDMSYELAKKWNSANRDVSEPVVIRLNPKYAGVSHTEYGTVLTQLSGGLDIVTDGSEENMKVEEPDTAEKDVLQALQREKNRLEDEKRHLENQRESLNRRMEEYRKLYEQSPQEAVEEFIENIAKLQLSQRATTDHLGIEENGVDRESSTNGSEGLDIDAEQISKELESDD